MTAPEATVADIQSQPRDLKSEDSTTIMQSQASRHRAAVSIEYSRSQATDPAEIAYLMGQLRKIHKQQATS